MDKKAKGTEYTFKNGDIVLLLSEKGKKWLVRAGDGFLDTHFGRLDLSKLIGTSAGSKLISSKGCVFYCMPPTLADFILLMKRKSQIIYPKDLAAIVFYGDVKPGDVVLETGTGSGALTIALLRAVGADGEVISVERREDFLKVAKNNIRRYFAGLPANLKLLKADIKKIELHEPVDKVFLDLPSPWDVINAVSEYLVNGGTLVSHSPNVGQVQKTVAELVKQGYADISTFEILRREWIVDELRARPKDRMVAHTGFITIARKVMKR